MSDAQHRLMSIVGFAAIDPAAMDGCIDRVVLGFGKRIDRLCRRFSRGHAVSFIQTAMTDSNHCRYLVQITLFLVPFR